jgi:hypothetical protein
MQMRVSALVAAIVLALSIAVSAAPQTQRLPISRTVLTVSTSVLAVPAATLRPDSSAPPASYCEFTVETADVRFYYTGDTPSGTSGHLWPAGGLYSLTGSQALAQLRMIRKSTAVSDATVTVSCWR